MSVNMVWWFLWPAELALAAAPSGAERGHITTAHPKSVEDNNRCMATPDRPTLDSRDRLDRYGREGQTRVDEHCGEGFLDFARNDEEVIKEMHPLGGDRTLTRTNWCFGAPTNPGAIAVSASALRFLATRRSSHDVR